MKRIFIYIGVSLGVLCSACNDWLTVVPETIIEEGKVFSSEMALHQALAGLYITLSGNYAPGADTGGVGSVEALACSWEPSGYQITLGNHVYDDSDVESVNDRLFLGFYYVIANVNLLINGMEPHKSDIQSEVYEMVRGEAFATRALVHFDLMRLYGPVPSKADMSYTYLPYVTTFSDKRYTYHTFEEYMGSLRADLDSAEVLLGKWDPVLNESFASSESGVTWSYRKNHLNYYAVLALQARVHLWMGDKEGALQYARLIRDAKDPSGDAKLKLIDNTDSYLAAYTDYTCYCEQIFGTYCDYYDVTVGGLNPTRTVTMNVKNTFPEKVFHNNDDFRAKYMYRAVYNTRPYTLKGYAVRKYDGFRRGYDSPRSFPVIRLAEIYLMIAECAPLDEANEAWEALCDARDFEYVPLTEVNRLEMVKWEYIREFMGEGQNFYTYKRFNERKMWFTENECSEEQYRLPIPQREFVVNK